MGRLAVALLCLMISGAALAAGSPASERRFKIPDRGELVLRIPVEWNAQLRPSRFKHRPPTIIFTPAAGTPFKFLVSAIHPKRRDDPSRSEEDDRAFVAQAADRAKGRAVDEDIPVVEFKASSGLGFYFSSKDRIAQDGEFKFLTEGVVRLDDLSVTFTILTNEGQEPIVEQALAALKAASLDTDKRKN